ncbi:MAG TPA: nucleotide pyrophosphohydrolase [Lentisphaeria bacterium]|nr:MAG: nucleotide pyrophosphohydrolase [Lentisphaerae bacterium GWF2_49_21]HBC86072.1 nucleotide pyrophosphohydrolase [Lentisphaeria bacterium]
MGNNLKDLKVKLRKFARNRDWDKFHSPKNLSMALNVEASELLEIFQWLTEDQSLNLPKDKLNDAREEIGDIFNYTVRIADRLGIDPLEAAFDKIKKNHKKYPVRKSRGSSRKYTEL